MRNRSNSLLDLLAVAPWWVSVVLGVIVFVGLRWVLPASVGESPIARGLVQGLPPIAWCFAVPFAITATASAVLGAKRRRLVDQQTSLESLRSVSWKDFEFMVAEAFRRQSYQVDFSLGAGADGGVDLVLRRDGLKSLVQCKQWRTLSVGVPVIREQFGILTAEGADECVVVTSGSFTPEAVAFAREKPIRLVDGSKLLDLVKSVQAPSPEGEARAIPYPDSTAATPNCPECGQPMAKRSARQDRSAGQQFWACSTFPKCRGTRPVK